LCFVTLLTQDHPDIPGEALENAQFGASLAASIWEDDATEPVLHFVGAPGLDVADVPGAGGLVQLEVDWDEDIDELTISGRLHTVESPHPGDHLGATVETSGSTWYAGAPDATVGDVPEAGLVAEGDVNQTGAAKVHHQGADGVQGAPESGDRFGAALAAGSDDRMWVGVPGEDLGTVDDAGMINGIGAHKRAFTQNTADDGSGKPVEGTAEAGNQFGTALLQVPDGTGLLVGVPGEDIRHVADAGSATGLFGHPSHSQETTGGTVTEGSRFGTAIGSTEGPIFGAPGTNDGAGAVYLRPTQDSDWTMWTLRVDRPASGDRYGSAFEVRNGYHGCC
jgi:hypothetical protein